MRSRAGASLVEFACTDAEPLKPSHEHSAVSPSPCICALGPAEERGERGGGPEESSEQGFLAWSPGRTRTPHLRR
jgi:hypothetical protein